MEDWIREVLERKLTEPEQRYIDIEVQAIIKKIRISEGLEQMYQLGLSAGYSTFYYLLEGDLSKEEILKVTKEGLKKYPYVLFSIDKIVNEVREGDKEKNGH